MRKILAVLLLWAAPGAAHAGLFDLASYVEPGDWSLGIEPEVIMSRGTGAGINFKPTFGIGDFLSWQGLIGVGSGARKFRLGATLDVEWFPDHEGQPGIATPLSFDYYRIENDGQANFSVKPMVYKTFKGRDAVYTPFVGVPVGWSLRSGNVDSTVQVALGCMFRTPEIEQWKYTLEAGFNAKNSYSFISGGVTYYP
jgi:hypothetical protein